MKTLHDVIMADHLEMAFKELPLIRDVCELTVNTFNQFTIVEEKMINSITLNLFGDDLLGFYAHIGHIIDRLKRCIWLSIRSRWSSCLKSQCIIYLAKYPEEFSPYPIYKIGYTYDVFRRLYSLNSQIPGNYDLTLMIRAGGKPFEDVRKEKFQDVHLCNEFFTLDDTHIQGLKDEYKDQVVNTHQIKERLRENTSQLIYHLKAI